MSQQKLVGVVAAVALIIGIVASIFILPPKDGDGKAGAGSGLETQVQYMQVYPEPRALPDFALTNHTGEAFTPESLKAHWTLGFIGYTFCPDICPVTLAAIARVYPQLEALKGNAPIQVVFFSVDPKRDNSERLGEYMRFFHPSFIGVTGEQKDLFPVVRGMGMMYSMVDSTDDPNYLIDHSASVVVINPQGQLIGRFKPEIKPGQLAISDVEQILADMPMVVNSGV